MDQDETWQAGRPRPWPHCVRWRPSSPSKRGRALQFLAHIYCGQMVGWIKMPLGMEVGLGPGDYVRREPSSLLRKGAEAPNFFAHVYCGQRAGWIKMALGMNVGLSPGDFVLDGDPAPRPKKGAPIFGPCLLRPESGSMLTAPWIKTPLGTEVGLSSDEIVLDWDPSPLPKRAEPFPNFRSMSVVAKRLDGSRWHLA